jgi:hypothetical protein
MILRSFYNGAFSIASKHDFDDQFLFLFDCTYFLTTSFRNIHIIEMYFYIHILI